MLELAEKKEIASLLSKYDSLFYAVMFMSEFQITKAVKTAAVGLNTDTMKPVYMFNPDFWKDKSIYGKAFLVCHEILHFVLGHLFRNQQRNDIESIQHTFKNLSEKEIHTLINKAMDISVNHTLLQQYAFEYEKVGYADRLCWIHTLFPKKEDAEKLGKPHLAQHCISSHLNYEKYLKLLLELKDNNPSESDKPDSKKSNKTESSNNDNSQDQSNDSSNDDSDDSTGEVLDDHDGEIDSDILNEEGLGHIVPFDQADDSEKEGMTQQVNETLDKLDKGSKDKLQKICDEVGDSGGQLFSFTVPNAVQTLSKWEAVCKNRIASIMKMGKKRYDNFHHIPNFMRAMPNRFRLPDYKEVERMTPDKYKLMVFVDSSGSMTSIIPRLIGLLNTIPSDKFDVQFCFFDVKVYPIQPNAMGKYEQVNIPQGGGTLFNICEQYLQQQIANKTAEYPDLVWMWTDGAGNTVLPEFANKWTVFLTGNFTETAKRCLIHIKDVVKLKDFI